MGGVIDPGRAWPRGRGHEACGGNCPGSPLPLSSTVTHANDLTLGLNIADETYFLDILRSMGTAYALLFDVRGS